MVEFDIIWMGESGHVCTDTGRTTPQQIQEWNAQIRQAVETGDTSATISVPHLDGDTDWSGDKIRAILVKEITPRVTRPADWQ